MAKGVLEDVQSNLPSSPGEESKTQNPSYHVRSADSVPGGFHHHFTETSEQLCKVDPNIMPILFKRKPRDREVKESAWGHTALKQQISRQGDIKSSPRGHAASWGQRWDLNSGLLTPRSEFFPLHPTDSFFTHLHPFSQGSESLPMGPVFSGIQADDRCQCRQFLRPLRPSAHCCCHPLLDTPEVSG